MTSPGPAPLRVLVCDSEPQGLRALRAVLGAAGLEVDTATTAEQALDRAAVRPPDAAIVALELPDQDGIEVCLQLRQWSSMPLLILGAADDEDQTVRALGAGADDYIAKPFRPGELVARVRAKLRRAEPAPAEPRIRLHGLEIDLAARVLRHDHFETHLTPIEFKLLRELLDHRGRPLSQEFLLRRAWGPASIQDTQTLRAHISNLRRKMRPFEDHIRTTHGVGYRFVERPWRTDRSRPLRVIATPSASSARRAA
jgi:two-component system, OmpR family, KDP operon response regulator KdpE